MNSRFFIKQDLQRIKAAVGKAEAKTSGEIVPVIAAKSVHYAWLVFLLGVLGLAAGTCTGLWLSHYWPFAAELSTIFALQGGGLALGALLGRSAWIMRKLLGDLWMEQEVFSAAQLAFVKEGLFNTRDHTGILIYISLRERRVVILADKGINEKVSPTYWDEEVKKIVIGLRNGTAGDALVEVVEEVGGKLAEHFPKKADDTNELEDQVRLR
ncbi:MAG: TPM domain-containing protein [Bacteriovoracia bacterium]